MPGDPLPLPHAFDLTRDDEIDRLFGPGFAAQLAELPLERWAGPIESGYGLHLARVRDRSPAEMPELDDARRSVLREWTAARRKQIREKIYQALRERYTVEIILPEPTDGAATPTVSGAGQ